MDPMLIGHLILAVIAGAVVLVLMLLAIFMLGVATIAGRR